MERVAVWWVKSGRGVNKASGKRCKDAGVGRDEGGDLVRLRQGRVRQRVTGGGEGEVDEGRESTR